MKFPLRENEQQLLALLLELPPRFGAAKALLQTETFHAEEITGVAICYVEECALEVGDTFWGNERLSEAVPPQGIVDGLHSSYVYDVIKLLLEFGLDPNAVLGDEYSPENVMQSLLYIDNSYLAADTIALLLEHGGDPDLILDGESLFEQVDFEVWFGSAEQEIRWRYDAWVHIWMVLLSCGRYSAAVQTFTEYGSDTMFDLRKLRNHRDFYFGLSAENNKRVIHLYDKKTFWEVVRG